MKREIKNKTILNNPQVQEIKALLDSGNWTQKNVVTDMIKGTGIGFIGLSSALELAESDPGYWVCIPGSNTPLFPPDEILKSEKLLFKLLKAEFNTKHVAVAA